MMLDRVYAITRINMQEMVKVHFESTDPKRNFLHPRGIPVIALCSDLVHLKFLYAFGYPAVKV